MKSVARILIFAAVAVSAETINFDSAKTGTLPPGWSSAMTHKGGAPKWEVLPDATAPSKPNVLAPQTGKVGLWTKADSVTHFDDFEFK